MVYPMAFMINDLVVTSPDEWLWTPEVLGVTHDNHQIRSPYWTLTFRKRASRRKIDWLTYDNVVLSSLTVPSHDEPRSLSRYTEATCLSVVVSMQEGIPTGVTATFRVNTEAR